LKKSTIPTSVAANTNVARYEGERLGNLRNGRGRCFYPNGELYEGEWKSDKVNKQKENSREDISSGINFLFR